MNTPYTKAPRHCQCGEVILQEGWGRPRQHCSSRCRQKAYRRRKRLMLVVTEHRKRAGELFSDCHNRQGVTKVSGSPRARGNSDQVKPVTKVSRLPQGRGVPAWAVKYLPEEEQQAMGAAAKALGQRETQ